MQRLQLTDGKKAEQMSPVNYSNIFSIETSSIRLSNITPALKAKI
jgi:hypothetical protein